MFADKEKWRQRLDVVVRTVFYWSKVAMHKRPRDECWTCCGCPHEKRSHCICCAQMIYGWRGRRKPAWNTTFPLKTVSHAPEKKKFTLHCACASREETWILQNYFINIDINVWYSGVVNVWESLSISTSKIWNYRTGTERFSSNSG